MKIIYLYPQTAMTPYLDSDSLWGHIMWGIKRIAPEVDFFSLYKNEPPFIITSPFPFLIKDGKILRFYPKPVFYENPKVKIEQLKSYSKCKFILEEDLIDILDKKNNEKDFIIKNKWEKYDLGYQDADVQQNTIDRLNGTTLEGSLFTNTRRFFKKDSSGFFFLIKGNDLSLVLASLRWLSINGIGRDTSTGKGYFKISNDFEEFNNFNSIKGSNNFVTLSKYYPASDELNYYLDNKINISYELSVKKGKLSKYSMATDVWKKTLTYFNEGSIFSIIQGKKYYGTTPIVKNADSIELKYDALGYGYAFPIYF
jgi:CRISPR-associated protein Csm4